MAIASPHVVVLDFQKPKQLSTIRFLQFDTNIIKFVIEDNGEVADLNNITNIIVNLRRSDKKVISQVLTADGNEIIYRLTNSEMLKVGDCEVALQLYDDEERVTIAKFKIIISDNIEIGDAPTVEDISLVQSLIESVNERLVELVEYDNQLTAVQNGLASKASIEETARLSTVKADRTYVDTIVSNLSSGGPRDVFYSIDALESAFPNGEIGTYLVFDSSLSDGAHSFIWSEGTWVDVGIYQGLGIADKSVTKEKLADNAVTVDNIEKAVSKQKFNEATVSNNQRVDVNTGELGASSGYHTSDFIPIEPDTNTIIIAKSNSVGGMNPNNIVYYNENKVRISGQNTGSLTPDGYGRLNLTPPANAKFLRYSVQGVYQRLGIFFNTYSDNFNYYTYYEFDKSKWIGKKIVAYGDSLVAGASNATTTWLGMLAKQFGFEPINRGIGGSTVLTSDTERIAWVSDGVTDKTLGEYGEYVSRPSSLNDGSGQTTGTTQPAGTVEILSSMCTDARVNTIPTDADAIIILAGTNGMDEASYRLMLQKIYTRCPQAIVLCCSLTFRYNDDARTQITDVTNHNNIIQNLSQEFGSHYIDLKGKESINHYNKNIYLSDKIHATVAGNERRAMVISSVIKNVEPLN